MSLIYVRLVALQLNHTVTKFIYKTKLTDDIRNGELV
jgi:hypothetical protein